MNSPGCNYKIPSDWIHTWIEQNINCIQNDIREISEPEEIKDYLFEILQNAYDYLYSREREEVKQKQADGIRLAMENGIHFGRSRIEIPAEFYKVYSKYKSGEISSRKCGEKLNVSHSTFLKWIKEFDESTV